MYSNRNWEQYGPGGGRYPSGYSSRGPSSIIPLPPGMNAGAIIGRGGSNIRMLQARSGARISVNDSNDVVISGSETAVEAAKRMVQLQIDAFTATGGSYPHPQQTHYILGIGFGDSDSNRVTFRSQSDEVALATGRREQLLVLHPMLANAVDAPRAEALADMMSALMLRTGEQSGTTASPPPFLLRSQQSDMLQATTTAVQQAVCHRPKFDDIKIRFTFGKNFFYRGPSTYTDWSLRELQAKKIPRDMKSVFSNAVTTTARDRLEGWLQQQGFRLLEHKSSVSVHLVQTASNAGYTMSLVNNDGFLSLRKLKSGNTKLAFCTLLNGPNKPDWRYKLLAQHHFNRDAPTKSLLTNLASRAQLSQTGGVTLSGLSAADMVKDKERHKEKTIYLGTWCDRDFSGTGTQVKVTISKVFDPMTGQLTNEVAGTSGAVNKLLVDSLPHGSLNAADEQQLMRHLVDIMSFAHAATGSMGDQYAT